jgi:hypothetical protein
MPENVRMALFVAGMLIFGPLLVLGLLRLARWCAVNLLVLLTLRRGVRYTGRRWQVVRNYVLDRDDRTCVVCGESHRLMHVCHRKAVARGGSHQTRNLETRCYHCHRDEHPWMPAIPPGAAGPLAGSRRRRRAFRG